MARRLRVNDDDREWIAELGTSGVTLSGVEGTFAVSDEGDGHFQLVGLSTQVTAVAIAGAGDAVWISIDGHVFELRVRPDAGAVASSRDHDALSPPMSATVVRIMVRPGAEVQPGDTLLVLEAMKMELPIRAPRAGVVRAIHCQEGDLVQPGTVLIEL
jgi:3-methylcrotonyl-CoA carboxylase alpha subunit